MGSRRDVICSVCATHFSVDEGGGFIFHLLHCDACGGTRAIGFAEIGEVHLRYIKGLDVPYCMATADADRRIQAEYEGEAMGREDYEAQVEDLVGGCECGGRFRFAAPPRCPNCRSSDYIPDPRGGWCCYD